MRKIRERQVFLKLSPYVPPFLVRDSRFCYIMFGLGF
jgi:hypothetical protein